MSRLISVYEWDTLYVNREPVPGNDVFTPDDFAALQDFLSGAPDCGFYSLLNRAVRFKQFVGVLQLRDLTIEVLPKTDRHHADKALWQEVLIKMIGIAHKVPVHVTTDATLMVTRRRILDTYILMFLSEVERLMHEGLLKRYRRSEGNQSALRGRLLIHKQIQHNLVHAESFYVAHTVYDRDNVFNAILHSALKELAILNVATGLRNRLQDALAFFPDCTPVQISDSLFIRLRYDRKTSRYQRAIEFAEVILRHLHPDIRRGKKSVLAIMFDMNRLWESFIIHTLRIAANRFADCSIHAESTAQFWRHPAAYDYRLEPDIEVRIGSETIILDTKWKHNSRTSIADLRQMYAYSHYFQATSSYLLYPDNLDGQKVQKQIGWFYLTNEPKPDIDRTCGIIKVDPIDKGTLNLAIGQIILNSLTGRNGETDPPKTI